ncbi:uncharacterized protein LOC110460174 [Mizuhopecten yessoensis]|uniref:uncharacterized protein LOC110460174 n=1 Tax=Mizuhopecten yessoensis TaxID=6573 RepID=UPI000B45B8E7|nr:uncharacterized protein LOC110460174 [Mizuhopecten yessoensis]
MASPLVDVYVKLPNGRTSTFALMPTDSANKIYDQVGKEEGVSGRRIRLKYQGKLVDKTRTIGYLGIRPETILKGEIVFPKTISIILRFEDGHTITMDVQNVDEISSIKSYIKEVKDIPTTNINLKIAGQPRVLRNDQLLFETGAKEESILDVSGPKSEPPSNSPEADSINEDPPEALKEDVLSSFDTNGKNVEVVFCFDTTGSMAVNLTTVRQNIKDTCTRLIRDIPGIRIGIMAHGDYCDQHDYVIKSMDLTSDVDQLVNFATSTPSTCGGDSPECYEWALRKAQQLDWSEDSAKAFVLIGDCEPHPPSYTDQRINWREEMEVLKGMGVKVYGVYCKAYTSPAEHFYGLLSEETGGCLLKLVHFSLITEMFLAVCYREAAPEQLEAYTEELEKEGKLSGDTKELMAQLDTKPTEGVEGDGGAKKAETIKRYVSAAWWDISLDHGQCSEYKYDAQSDRWSAHISQKHSDVRLSASGTGSVSRKKQNKRKCSIM